MDIHRGSHDADNFHASDKGKRVSIAGNQGAETLTVYYEENEDGKIRFASFTLREFASILLPHIAACEAARESPADAESESG